MAIKSDAQKKAVASYKAKNYGKISIDWPRDFCAQVRTAAEASGESLAGYVRKALEQRMEHDNQTTNDDNHITD